MLIIIIVKYDYYQPMEQCFVKWENEILCVRVWEKLPKDRNKLS